MVSAMTNMLKATRNSPDDGLLKGVLVHGFLDITHSAEAMPRQLRRSLKDLYNRHDIMIMEAKNTFSSMI